MFVILMTSPEGEIDVMGLYPSRRTAEEILKNDVPTIDGWDGWTGRVVEMISGDPDQW